MPRQRNRSGGLPKYPAPTNAQAVKAPSGKPQGERKKTEMAQKAMPLPDRQAELQQAALNYNPVTTPIGAPTQYPTEPLTAGMVQGPGPGPEALAYAPAGDDIGVMVRAMYRDFPNEDLRALIAELELEGR